jgi:putative nucleotidyltransferase with HDIG domain
MAIPDTSDLVSEITKLPVQPGAAMRLLWMLEDPRTSATDLGRLIESDPALSTQVIRLANTAFYGLSGKVASAWRAVTVLGLATVRAIATTAAFDLFSEKGRSVPNDFWQHSVTSAAGASALARRVGMPSSDAFSAGLLHDIGTALLFRRAPRRYDEVVEHAIANGVAVADAERTDFGMTHADIGGAALATMRFPDKLIEAVGKHHDDPSTVDGVLARVVIAADSLAHLVSGDREPCVDLGDALRALEIPDSAHQGLIDEVRQDQDNLAGFLSVRA